MPASAAKPLSASGPHAIDAPSVEACLGRQRDGVDLERLVDAIDLPIGRWDRRHRLTYCNAPYLGWAGRTREQLIGTTLAELYGDAAWAAARAAFAEGLAGRTVSYERRITHPEGAPRWARVKVFPELDAPGRVEALYTIGFDLHDDVLERQELHAARRRLDRFTDNIPNPLLNVDRDFVLRFVHRANVRNVGVPAEQLIGRHIGEARGERRWNEHRPMFERALAGETVQYTRLVELLPDGPRWLRTSYVPDFGPEGGVVGVYTVTIDVHEMTVAQEKLRRSVERDAVTDVLSRRAIIDRIEAALLTARAEAPVALYFVDLDGFKSVNDTLGHREGDKVLAAVGAALQRAMRVDDAVGRLGGDEFIVLAPVRDAAGASTLAQHLLSAVQGCNAAAFDAPRISASIGYALAPLDAINALKLVQRADDAMYAAKRQGRDQVVYCGATLD
jgi:diguanylate cyclase (GGDEF)-like protein/PAS domain S-box-containing protein